jgi:hypothetical protein
VTGVARPTDAAPLRAADSAEMSAFPEGLPTASRLVAIAWTPPKAERHQPSVAAMESVRPDTSTYPARAGRAPRKQEAAERLYRLVGDGPRRVERAFSAGGAAVIRDGRHPGGLVAYWRLGRVTWLTIHLIIAGGA